MWTAIDQPDMPYAACQDEPFLPWVPEMDECQGKVMVTKAELVRMKTVCFGCRHLAECQAFALDNPSVIGVWGGFTTAERRRLRRPSKKIA
jgi:Transcription factor WhiB